MACFVGSGKISCGNSTETHKSGHGAQNLRVPRRSNAENQVSSSEAPPFGLRFRRDALQASSSPSGPTSLQTNGAPIAHRSFGPRALGCTPENLSFHWVNLENECHTQIEVFSGETKALGVPLFQKPRRSRGFWKSGLPSAGVEPTAPA